MQFVDANDVELLRGSEFFDSDYYLAQYPDVAALGMDPVEHYLWLGARLKRNPSANFDTGYYLDRHRDVARSKHNPLVHFIKWGRAEGRVTKRERRHVARAKITTASSIAHWAGARESTLDGVAIVIPVYNAPEETEECLLSVLRHTPETALVILIDDASPDPRVQEFLVRYQDRANLLIVRNEKNLGFTRTVNRGIELAGKRDVVFLNSDTVVTPFWLRNLRIAAYSSDRIATATPFSNNAGAFSAPIVGQKNELPENVSLDQYARAITRSSERLYPEIPTGNGFCMYVRRACIEEIGNLDSEAFPRGYGEENDFCMRAGRAGWKHVIDDATYIYHVRSASFGDEKTPLMKAGRAVIDERYPDYTVRVRQFLADPRVVQSRGSVERALAHLATTSDIRPRTLYVISTKTGGTPQTNEDLMNGVSGSLDTYVLRCDSRTLTLYRFNGAYVELASHDLDEPIKAFPHRSVEYDSVVREWLVAYDIDLVHIRHIGWHGLGLIDEAAALDIPIVFSFHDFYAVCPTIKLLDNNKKYCAGRCTPGTGRCAMELWNTEDYPSLKNQAVFEWRRQLRPVLEKCAAFVTTSESARKQLVDAYPFLRSRRFEVIPHGRDFARFDLPQTSLQPGEKLRILVPGNISPAKGGLFLSELGKRVDDLGIEMHILGKVARAVDTSRGFVLHGEYKREDFLDKTGPIRPHIGAILSIWPETYCHTLTELWAAGIPVLAFDFGAVGERIREHGAGWLVDAELPSLIDQIRRISESPALRETARSELAQWQRTTGATHSVDWMAQRYKNLYRECVPAWDTVPATK